MSLVAGTKRRSVQRVAEERQKHPLGKIGNGLVFGVFGILIGFACLGIIQLAAGHLLRYANMVVGAQ